MVFSMRLTEGERQIAESYANLNSMSLSEAFKRALFEKIEDEYDLALAEKSYADYLEHPVTYSYDEVWDIIHED